MKVYMKDYGRPFGTEPLIHTHKPNLKECDDENPFGGPELLEFRNELEARVYFKKYYPDSYTELKVVK